MTVIIHCSCSQLSSTPPLPTTSFGIYFTYSAHTQHLFLSNCIWIKSFWAPSWIADLVWHSGLVRFGLRWSLKSLPTQIILLLSKQDHYTWYYILISLLYHSFPPSLSLLKGSRAQRQPRPEIFWTKSLTSGSKAGRGRSSWNSSWSHLSNLGSAGQTQRTQMILDDFKFFSLQLTIKLNQGQL